MIVEYIDNGGAVVENNNPAVEYKILAKKITTENTVRYQVRICGGNLVDGMKLSERELKKLITKFSDVPEDVYNKYCNYLAGNGKSSLRSIERSL
jgi:hypothetical protein